MEVAPKFKIFGLDQLLNKLKKEEIITKENISIILKTHNELMKKIKKITHLNMRSFCSKYLHFHRPEQFIMFDGRTEKTIGKYINKIPIEFKELKRCKNIDLKLTKATNCIWDKYKCLPQILLHIPVPN